jgi:hypothetical protein
MTRALASRHGAQRQRFRKRLATDARPPLLCREGPPERRPGGRAAEPLRAPPFSARPTFWRTPPIWRLLYFMVLPYPVGPRPSHPSSVPKLKRRPFGKSLGAGRYGVC